jgi:hypothetical protein
MLYLLIPLIAGTLLVDLLAETVFHYPNPWKAAQNIRGGRLILLAVWTSGYLVVLEAPRNPIAYFLVAGLFLFVRQLFTQKAGNVKPKK